MEYLIHPAANLFPMMSEARLQELADDIAEHGLQVPITLLDKQVIDGRNRLKACEIAGVTPRFEDAPNDANPWQVSWALNGQRRDLDEGQRYLIWAECAEQDKEWQAAQERHRAAANEARAEAAREQHKVSNPRAGEEKPVSGSATKSSNTKRGTVPETKAQRKADAAGVGVGTVNRADALKSKRPDLADKVKAGEVGISAAYSQMRKDEREQDIQKQREEIAAGTVSLPEGLFEVVVMDPPWAYGREYDPETSRVANPYPEMQQSELLEMEPPFAKDCVLFLWTTHRFIWDAKELLDRWGFAYKATIVWDKDKIGMGATLRMQCEFCLVAFKGKSTWTNTTWRDIIREPRRQHSRKPDIFYELVEDCTVGRRLDFFSREAREGWEAFGNDADKF